MKKVLAAVLAAAMSLSVGAVAFAADTTPGLSGTTTTVTTNTEYNKVVADVTTAAQSVDTNIKQMLPVMKNGYFPALATSTPGVKPDGKMTRDFGGQYAVFSRKPIYAVVKSAKKPDLKINDNGTFTKKSTATSTALRDYLNTVGGLTNGGTFNVTESWGVHLYQYDSGSLKMVLKTTDKDVRADVADGHIKVKQNRHNTTELWGYDGTDWLYLYEHIITISPDYGVRDFDIKTWTVELDLGDDGIFYIKGDGAYSVARTVGSNERLAVKPSTAFCVPDDEKSGSIFNFTLAIDGETRIRCEDGGSKFVDLFFNGNYDTRRENLRVKTDSISAVEDYFEENYDEPDIDYYDFVGRPKFATAVKVRIDADKESYIYEFDSKTGDLTNITDECTWESDGWTFKRKYLTTYIIAEELYEDANVSVEEPDVDEPTDEPTDAPSNGDKDNPGTGANDMVGVAAALAVVSLAAAGAVAFKKASK